MRCKRVSPRRLTPQHLRVASLKQYLSRRKTAVEAYLQQSRGLSAEASYEISKTLRLSPRAYHALNKQYDKRISRGQSHPLPINNVQGLINQARRWLLSDRRYDILAGLIILTGRRPYELAADPEADLCAITSKIKNARVSQKYFMMFEGQAKIKRKAETNASDKSYIIPVLAPADEIRDALLRMRFDANLRAGLVFCMDNYQFNSRSTRTMMSRIDALVGDSWPTNHFQRKMLSYKALRALYAEVCNIVFNGGGLLHGAQKPQSYISRILGHVATSKDISGAYMRFTFDENLKPTVVPEPDIEHIEIAADTVFYDRDQVIKDMEL